MPMYNKAFHSGRKLSFGEHQLKHQLKSHNEGESASIFDLNYFQEGSQAIFREL